MDSKQQMPGTPVPQAGGDGGPEDLMKGLSTIQESLAAIAKGFEGTPVQDKFAEASQCFNEAVAAFTGGGSSEAMPAPGGSENAAGNPNAKPVG